jgi:sec-independent protein translocase protein TatB
MFDFSGSELLIIAIVALVVIGPKDLPKVLRGLGKWAGKARAVAREFQSSIDQMIRESELEDLKKEVEAAKTEVEKVAATDVGHEIEQSVDPKGELHASLQTPELADAANNPTGTPGTSTPSAGEAAVAQPTETAPAAETAPSTEPAPPASTEKKPETQTAA